MRTKDYFGGFIIVLGVLLLISNNNITSFHYTWPVFILYLGVMFLISFIREKRLVALIMPATILIIISILFLYCAIVGWRNMGDLWPFFIIAPGVGLLLMHYFGDKNEGLFTSGTITVSVGITFLVLINFDLPFIGVILICLGLYFLFVKK